MKNGPYFFEIKDILTQFVAAFDDIVIKRYDNNRVLLNTVEVRYVLAPKQRVMYDIVNAAHNLTLPVVAVSVSSISRDQTRVFNKLDSVYNASSEKTGTVIKMPIPVNITLKMSILARYMEDMDQILSNFIPYNNPYIILSWKEPTINNNFIEIRSEVQWDGNILLNSPEDTTYNDKIRIVADTTFTIKGWLFKNSNETTAPIYFIETNYTAVNRLDTLDYNKLSGGNIYTESFKISGYPVISSVFYNTSGRLLTLDETLQINQDNYYKNNILLYGSNFQFTDAVLLSSANSSLFTSTTTLSTARMGNVVGYNLPAENYQILANNHINVNLPTLSGTGDFVIVIKNPAGYASTFDVSQSVFSIVG